MSTKDSKHEQPCTLQSVKWRKLFPFLPIIGIPLTFIYHKKYGDTGIENTTISCITAAIQSISIFCLFFYDISATAKF